VVRVPKAAGAVIDPGIRKIDPVIARQTAPLSGSPTVLPSGLLPVLQIGVANGLLIALRSGSQIAEAIALRTVARTVAQTATQTVA
jgi:hypothetical protein